MPKQSSRRDFLKTSSVALAVVGLYGCKSASGVHAVGQDRSRVFFTEDISADGLRKVYARVAAPDNENYENWLKGEPFQENMVESAKAVIDHFGKTIVFINVLRNMSVDCDCAGVKAAPVKAHDLGILASTDLLALEQASIDMVYKLPEAELHDLKERIESRKGLRQLSYMKEMKMGNNQYEIVPL